jgi:hypothetical protein
VSECVFRPALWVGFFEKSRVGAQKVGDKLLEPELFDRCGRFRDVVVVAIRERFPESPFSIRSRSAGLYCFERREFLF